MDTKNSKLMLICLLLALVPIAVFLQVKDHAFINYDDFQYVTENPYVRIGLSLRGIKWAFTTFYESNWHPLTWLSHMLDCWLFGLRPSWHHLTNFFFHIANTVLLFFVLRRMTKSLWQSVCVAALFALHPLHVESVAWIAERKDVLSTFFWVLTMGAYARYTECPGIGRYLLVFTFFILGLMCKPMLVTLPFVLLLLDYWPLGRLQPAKPTVDALLSGQKNPRRKKQRDTKVYAKDTVLDGKVGILYQRSVLYSLIREKAPLFAFSAISSVITFYAQQKGGAMASFQAIPPGSRLGNVLISYTNYIGKMIWPRNMAVLYPFPASQPLWHIFGAALILLVITILVVGRIKRSPYLAVGWFWFVGTLVPVIGLVQVGMQAMADRYTYIPLTGLFIMAAWAMPELLKKWRQGKAVLSASAVIILLAFAIVTNTQLQYWRDSTTLFRHALDVTENNELAHNALGFAFSMKGQIDEAITHYQEAIRLKPDYAQARNYLGNALVMKGQIDEAIGQYQEAIRLKSDYAQARNNLGNALCRRGQIDECISQYQEAIRLKSDYAEARNNLGNALVIKGQIDEAISQYQEAIRLRPDHAEAGYNFGNALVMKGQIDEAISQYQEAIRLKPDHAEAHYNLGNALRRKGQIDECISQYEEAIRLRPDHAEARNDLGNALVVKGQIDKAVSQYEEAIRLKPDFAEALNNLGFMWAERGDNLHQARAMIEKAVKLEPKNAAFLDSMGWVLFKLNRTAEALDYSLKAIDNSDEPNASIYDHLGDIYAALNQRAKAAAAWRKSLSIEPNNKQIQKKIGE